MLAPTVPWWELIIRVSTVYVALLVLMRISGKRTLGQSTPFDLLVLLLLSEGVSNGLTGGDQSLVGAVLAAVMLVALNYGASVLTARNERAKRLIEGVPRVIGRDGRLFPEVLRRENVAVGDVHKRLREERLELEDVGLVLLETDGDISFLHREPPPDRCAVSDTGLPPHE